MPCKSTHHREPHSSALDTAEPAVQGGCDPSPATDSPCHDGGTHSLRSDSPCPCINTDQGATPLGPVRVEDILVDQGAEEVLGQLRNGTGVKRWCRPRRADRTSLAARPVIENYCRAAGKLTRGGMGASPGEKWSQGGKLGKAERSPHQQKLKKCSRCSRFFRKLY